MTSTQLLHFKSMVNRSQHKSTMVNTSQNHQMGQALEGGKTGERGRESELILVSDVHWKARQKQLKST